MIDLTWCTNNLKIKRLNRLINKRRFKKMYTNLNFATIYKCLDAPQVKQYLIAIMKTRLQFVSQLVKHCNTYSIPPHIPRPGAQNTKEEEWRANINLKQQQKNLIEHSQPEGPTHPKKTGHSHLSNRSKGISGTHLIKLGWMKTIADPPAIRWAPK